MDSITQAALGAAVGHAVLGKRMGNKAIVIGAFAGTIPDLDVISRFFSEHHLYGLVYHRGVSHSIFFTLVASPIFAWLSLKYYSSGLHQKKAVQIAWAVLWGTLYAGLAGGLGYASIRTGSSIVIGITILVLLGGFSLYKTLRTQIENCKQLDYDPSFRRWTIMYGLAFMTHWIIDTCTAYGTQIFEPFSNYRVSTNNISIVDPLYTVPILIGLMGAIWAKRYPTERRWNTIGLGISTLYMCITFGIKIHVNQVVEANLKNQNIPYKNYITYPSIFNTVLWQTTIETEDAYYYSNYSLFDSQANMDFTKLPKNHDYLAPYPENKYLDILKWFSRGYYNVIKKEDGQLTFNILLFGLLGVPADSNIPIEDRYVFRFILVEKNGQLDVERDKGVERIPIRKAAQALWERIKGN